MEFNEWSKSTVGYGKRLLNSGIEGARSGGELYLEGKPFLTFLGESVQSALKFAVIGACAGIVASKPSRQRKSMTGAVGAGLIGGAIGLSVGIAWESRRLSASAASSALKQIDRTRDEQWLSKNPINYA